MKIIVKDSPVNTVYEFQFDDTLKDFKIINYRLVDDDIVRLLWFHGGEYDNIHFVLDNHEAIIFDDMMRSNDNTSFVRQVILYFFMIRFKENKQMIASPYIEFQLQNKRRKQWREMYGYQRRND